MIELTRLNGSAFHLNALFIEQVQALPDTTITTYHGKKLIVKESETEVLDKITGYYKMIGLAGVHRKVGEQDE
ncbi:flagellar FlbD family protein [Thalassobacillus hwangdonensis]|uniref:Flagellar FlbD family protein n=1 Tax=Thalassobacillus hwangdonensis TaxID=546108 RepID=A0ABW3L0S9_9BACI